MNRTIKFQAIAEAELNEAVAWYESKHDNLGLEFLQEIDRCLRGVAEKPLQFHYCKTKFATSMRAASLTGFTSGPKPGGLWFWRFFIIDKIRQFC